MSLLNRSYITRIASIFVTITLVVVALYYLKIVMVPLLFAIIFAVMIFPFCVKFEKWGLSKGLAAFTTVFTATLILSFLIYLLFTQLTGFLDQVPQLTVKVNGLINNIKDFAAEKFSLKRAVVSDKVQEQLAQLQKLSGNMLAGSLSTISSLLINIFLIPLYIFFLIYYRHFFIEFFYKIFPDSDKEFIDDTIKKIEVVIKGYLFGQVLDIIVIGSANALCLYFIGVGYAILLGFFISFLCIVPYLGMIAGSLIAMITALLTTHTAWQPLSAFGVLWAIHILDSNIVTPLLVGSRVNINPLIAIFVLFLFGELWGLPGLFLGIPLAAILKVIFDEVEGLKAFGFLLGTPEKYHLKKHSYLHIKQLHRLIEFRKQKPMIDSLPGDTSINPPPENHKETA